MAHLRQRPGRRHHFTGKKAREKSHSFTQEPKKSVYGLLRNSKTNCDVQQATPKRNACKTIPRRQSSSIPIRDEIRPFLKPFSSFFVFFLADCGMLVLRFSLIGRRFCLLFCKEGRLREKRFCLRFLKALATDQYRLRTACGWF